MLYSRLENIINSTIRLENERNENYSDYIAVTVDRDDCDELEGLADLLEELL